MGTILLDSQHSALITAKVFHISTTLFGLFGFIFVFNGFFTIEIAIFGTYQAFGQLWLREEKSGLLP